MIQALQERRREMLEEKKTMIEDEAVMKTREQDSDIMESAAAEKVTKEVIEEGTMGEEQNELAEPEGAELTLNSTYTIEPSTESSCEFWVCVLHMQMHNSINMSLFVCSYTTVGAGLRFGCEGLTPSSQLTSPTCSKRLASPPCTAS